MRVGIVAEGPADVAVVMNILHGKLGVERKDVLTIRPELTLDETDLAEKRKAGYEPRRPGEYSNWQLVLEECRERENLARFLDSPIDEDRLLVIHVDTSEAELEGYDVKRPEHEAPDYVAAMRARVVARLEGLLGEDIARQTRFAVAVEETDAWVLALFSTGNKDTGLIRNPKKRLEHEQTTRSAPKSRTSKEHGTQRTGERRARAPKRSAFDSALEMSEGFRDPETLSTCAPRNASLALFVGSLAP